MNDLLWNWWSYEKIGKYTPQDKKKKENKFFEGGGV